MNMYTKLSQQELQEIKAELEKQHEEFRAKKLALNMSRGTPCTEQLDLTNDMLTHCLDGDHISENGVDCRNYGVLDGIYEAKRLFMEMLGVGRYEIIIGGNSSLELMYDTLARALLLGVKGSERPWRYNDKVKFLCPVPGYDRHFSILQNFDIEMINIPMLETGPDMDMVERLVAEDESIKGIYCVPMYSNPTGVTFSDETVRRFARLQPKARDFRIFWDNAYCCHHITDTPDTLLNILDECKKAGNPDLPIIFSSTSKISFPGGGIGIIAASEDNIKFMTEQLSYQTIGFDKLNQLRHAKFFKNYDGIKAHMEKHRVILEPKFNEVFRILSEQLEPLQIGRWNKPNGGYFVSFDGPDNTAKRTIELCKDAGVVMTPAGATFPYGKDPHDSNIRIAPTFPKLSELNTAMYIFCNSVKLATVEALLQK